MKTRILLVTGSRSINDRHFVFNILKEYDFEILIFGDAEGVDTLAFYYCLENHKKYLCFSPDWEKYGKRAGLVRNEEMVRLLTTAQDYGIAIWDGESPGTKDTISRLQKKQRLLKIYYYNSGLLKFFPNIHKNGD